MKAYGSKYSDFQHRLQTERDFKWNLGKCLLACHCQNCRNNFMESRRWRKLRTKLSTRNASRTLKKRARQQSKKLINERLN